MIIYMENSKHSVLVLRSIAEGMNTHLLFAAIVKNRRKTKNQKQRENYNHQMSHPSTIQCGGLCPLSDAAAQILMPFKGNGVKNYSGLF